MKVKKHILTGIVSLTAVLAFWSCNSPEYTSAKMYVQQENLPKAEEYFLKALDTEPTNPEVPFLLAIDVYQKQEKYDLVKKYLDMSLQRGPRFETEIANQFKYNWGTRYNDGVKYYNAIVKDEATDRDKAISKAIDDFRIAFIFNPKDENTAVQLARCYYDLADDKDKALDFIDEALKTVEPKSNLEGLKARYLVDMDRKDDAIALLTESVKNDPENLKNIENLGVFLFEAGKYDEATQIYKDAIVNFPTEKDLYFNLGLLYIKLNDLDNANLQFQQVLSFDPSDLEVVEAVGDVYINQQDYISAEGYYRQLLDADPMNPNYMRKLANALNGQKRYEEGLDLIRQAKALE